MPLESSAQHRHHLTQCRSPYLVIDPHACSIRQDDLDPTHAKCRRLRRGRRRTWRGCVYRLSGGLYLALGAPFALQNSYGQKFRHNRRWDQLTTANLMPPCPKLTTRNIVPPGHMRKHRPRRLSLSNNPKLLLQPPAARFSRRSGMTVLGCRFMPSGWTVESLSGRRPWTASWHFRPDRWAICSKASIGAIRSKAGARKPPDRRNFCRACVEFCSDTLWIYDSIWPWISIPPHCRMTLMP
jgi:hypothetical protein